MTIPNRIVTVASAVAWAALGVPLRVAAVAADARLDQVLSLRSSSCPQTPVIPNGGFESGELSPWAAEVEAPATIKVVPGGYNQSKYAAQLAVGPGAEYAALYQSAVPACQDYDYNVVFAYKRLRATASCYIFAQAEYPEGKYEDNNWQHNLTAATEPGGWAIGSIAFNSLLNEPFQFTLGLDCTNAGASAAVLFDDIHLVSLGSAAAPGCPRPPSPIQNGGFEADHLAPWSGYANPGQGSPEISFVSPGYQGNYALQLHFPANEIDQWGLTQNVTQLCEGSTYKWSFAIKWLTHPAGAPSHYAYVDFSLGNCGDNMVYPNDTASSSGWIVRSVTCQNTQNGFGYFGFMVSGLIRPVPAFTILVDSLSLELA